jgi:hypothetical protein
MRPRLRRPPDCAADGQERDGSPLVLSPSGAPQPSLDRAESPLKIVDQLKAGLRLCAALNEKVVRWVRRTAPTLAKTAERLLRIAIDNSLQTARVIDGPTAVASSASHGRGIRTIACEGRSLLDGEAGNAVAQ